MDPLSRLFQPLCVDGLTVERLESWGSWGTYVPQYTASTSILLVIGAGELWIEALDDVTRPVRWTAGDVVLLLPGYRFTARTVPHAGLRTIEELAVKSDARKIRWGHGGALTRVTALHCSVPSSALTPFEDALEPMVRVDERFAVGPAMVRSLVQRDEAEHPGAHAALERMAELVLVEAITERMARHGTLPEPLVDEPPIARALMLIHARPEKAWTVTSLARQVGMSRTTFATHFAAQVGESPIHHLTRTRIERAEHLLATTSEPLAAIARRVGYREVAAFCRAFKRVRGRTPGTVRHRSPAASSADPASAHARAIARARGSGSSSGCAGRG